MSKLIGPVNRRQRQNLAKQLAMANYVMLSELINKRIESGLTQKDVADLLQVSQQYISKFESLESDPRLSTISKYAMAINVLIEHKIREFPVRDDVRLRARESVFSSKN